MKSTTIFILWKGVCVQNSLVHCWYYSWPDDQLAFRLFICRWLVLASNPYANRIVICINYCGYSWLGWFRPRVITDINFYTVYISVTNITYRHYLQREILCHRWGSNLDCLLFDIKDVCPFLANFLVGKLSYSDDYYGKIYFETIKWHRYHRWSLEHVVSDGLQNYVVPRNITHLQSRDCSS